MKLLIGDRVYDPVEALNESSLTFIADMNRQCGFGPKTLSKRLLAIAALADMTDVTEDADLMEALIALFWTVRAHAGETLTLREAGKVDLNTVTFRLDDDEDEPADPMQASDQTGSAGDDADDAEPKQTLTG